MLKTQIKDNQQWARIGNAVMPKMMEAIAKQIVVTLGK